MFGTKLKVMKARIYKLIKQKFLPLQAGDGGAVDKDPRPQAQGARQSTWGDHWMGLDEKLWSSLFRCLNLSVDSKLDQSTKVRWMFRKVFSPPFSKERRRYKILWRTREIDPDLSRGMKGPGSSEEKSVDAKPFDEGAEVSEQRIYTMDRRLPSKHFSSLGRKKDAGKTPEGPPSIIPKFFPARLPEFPPPEPPPRVKPAECEADAPKMKALLFEPNTLSLFYSEVSAPTRIYKDEVLVQVSYSGVCGWDLFATEGKVPCGNDTVVLGKEISGTVYAAGSDVHHVGPGDRVAVNALAGCGVCRYCRRGLESSCANGGVSGKGGWAEFATVRKTQVHKVPDELPLDRAVLLMPLSCILGALSRLDLSYGMKILVQGLGPPGCLWASVLHRRGFKKVAVSDACEKNRRRFEHLRLDYDFVAPEDVGKLSVDAVIECTGRPESIEKSFDVLNPKGHVCFFGGAEPSAEVRCLPHEITRKEMTITGSAGNSLCFPEAVDLATSMGLRYLDLKKLGAEVFGLEQFEEAFRMKKSGKVGKIIFKPAG